MLEKLLALLATKQMLLKKVEEYLNSLKAEISTLENRISLLKSADISAVILEQKSAAADAQKEELTKIMDLAK